MRYVRSMAASLALSILVGCAGPANQPAAEMQQITSARTGGRVTAHLLFDRRPSQTYAPEDFAYRTEWPGVDRDYMGGEFTEYEERIIDREGDFVSPLSQTYRQFSSRRKGVSYR